MEEMLKRIETLRRERDAVILAHYYVDDAVQALADFVGDSYYLSEVATKVTQRVILFCGVRFMGESAKILNPQKTVIMASAAADCPMAHMADTDKIEEMRRRYNDLAVVCYINSTAEIKAHSDVCVTSSNAVQVIRALPQKNIYFIPDENLGRYVSGFFPDKNFILGDGYCHVHTEIKREDILKAKEFHPATKVLAHPECTADVLELADYIGSTSGIIDYATKSPDGEFFICTEMGTLYELNKRNPGKRFYFVGHRPFCPNMKTVGVENVLSALESMSPAVELDAGLIEKCAVPLKRMLELARAEGK